MKKGLEMDKPKMKVGGVVEDCSDSKYKVLAISNKYEDVYKYDSTGACQEMVDDPETCQRS